MSEDVGNGSGLEGRSGPDRRSSGDRRKENRGFRDWPFLKLFFDRRSGKDRRGGQDRRSAARSRE